MIFPGAFVLPLYDRLDVGGKEILEGLSIVCLRDVLAAFAFLENGDVRTAGDCRLQVEPAAMQRSRRGPTCVRITAESNHDLAQIGRGLGAVLRALPKYGLQ